MSDHDKNIDDIKRKLQKKRQDTEFNGYTPKHKSTSKAKGPDEEDKKPANKKEKSDNKESTKRDSKSDSLTIEHYSDFDKKEDKEKSNKSNDKQDKNIKKEDKLRSKESKKETTKKTSEKTKKEKPKKERKPFKFKKIHAYILGLVFLLLLLLTILWYVFSSASDVKEINYNGNSLVSETELQERLGFDLGSKMFSISLSDAEENIELLPVIKDVTAKRDWPNGVTLDVNEYKAVAYINSEDLYFPVLENSRIQRGYPTAPKNAPIIYNFEGEEFDALVETLNNIEVDILRNISEIYFRPTDTSKRRIHVFMNDGQEIVADYETFADKMNYYIGIRQEIEEDSEGIIDMEVGTSFLPYKSAEAREIKENIYNEPNSASYIEDINESLNGLRDTLGQIDKAEEEK